MSESNINTQIGILPEGLVYGNSYDEPYDNYYHDLFNDIFYRDIIFKNKENGYYVEVGGLNGVINSQSFIFEKILKWDGIIVEPNPFWKDELSKYRKCNVSNNAISNVEGTALFECRSNHGFSGLKSNTSDARWSDIESEIEVQTTTLSKLFDTYNAPEIIDWVSIDVEGSEIDILSEYFSEKRKYKINLLNFETYQHYYTDKILESQPYLKIKNPYLDFLKITDNGLLKFNSVTGQLYKTPFFEKIYDRIDYEDINYEQYYIHLDYLKDNLYLKKFLIN